MKTKEFEYNEMKVLVQDNTEQITYLFKIPGSGTLSGTPGGLIDGMKSLIIEEETNFEDSPLSEAFNSLKTFTELIEDKFQVLKHRIDSDSSGLTIKYWVDLNEIENQGVIDQLEEEGFSLEFVTLYFESVHKINNEARVYVNTNDLSPETFLSFITGGYEVTPQTYLACEKVVQEWAGYTPNGIDPNNIEDFNHKELLRDIMLKTVGLNQLLRENITFLGAKVK
jgi:hypothetical protein